MSDVGWFDAVPIPSAVLLDEGMGVGERLLFAVLVVKSYPDMAPVRVSLHDLGATLRQPDRVVQVWMQRLDEAQLVRWLPDVGGGLLGSVRVGER